MVLVDTWYNFFISTRNCHEMASIFVYLLIPIAGLITIWLRKDLFAKFFAYLKGFYLPISYHTFGKEKLLLNWARKRLPPQWCSNLNTLSDGIGDFWKDGSLLCTLINSAVPGACPNPYRHWRKPPEHAQEVALKYLGVMPIFTNAELSSPLSSYIDAKLLKYLNDIRKFIHNLEKERFIYNLISTEFLVRGMGLYTAEQNLPAEFFVYSKHENANFLNIEICIFGPYCSCFKTTVSNYFIKEDKKDQRSSSTINIDIEIEKDRVRICYTSNNFGIHEIIISCNKENIRGSPFYINVGKCEGNALQRDEKSFKSLEEQTVKSIKCCNKNYTKNNSNIDNILLKPKNNNITTNVNFENNYKKNILSEAQKDNKTQEIEKIKTENVKDERQILEINKYLKNLSNTHEKEVNNNNSSVINIAKDNFSHFQKLVDSSYRKSCRITRTHPRLGQSKFDQFPYASPVCSDHIVPEDIGKLSLDVKRKMFSQKKSIAIDFNSEFSIDENKNKELKESSETIQNEKNLSKGEVSSNINKLRKTIKGNADNKKPSLRKIVKEQKLFWESAFDESKIKIKPNLISDAEFLGRFNKDLKEGVDGSKNYVKSLNKLKKRLSESLSDLRPFVQKQVFRSLDDNLDICCKTSLEDRTKLYFENVRFVTGDEVIKGVEEMFFSEKYWKKGKLSDNSSTANNDYLLHNIAKTSSDSTSKKSFKKAVAYFRNLEVTKPILNMPNKSKSMNDKLKN